MNFNILIVTANLKPWRGKVSKFIFTATSDTTLDDIYHEAVRLMSADYKYNRRTLQGIVIEYGQSTKIKSIVKISDKALEDITVW